MEIPEAYEKATTEIIDFECEAEMVGPLFHHFNSVVFLLFAAVTATFAKKMRHSFSLLIAFFS
ncbi:MAG: hypothetical protein GY765_17895 [bacterium]|nr:hypothetical protein [bacterium]